MEITLEAAMRDMASDDPESRLVAVRNLAREYLRDTGSAGPSWRAEDRDARGPRVRALLEEAALEGPEPSPTAGPWGAAGCAASADPEGLEPSRDGGR